MSTFCFFLLVTYYFCIRNFFVAFTPSISTAKHLSFSYGFRYTQNIVTLRGLGKHDNRKDKWEEGQEGQHNSAVSRTEICEARLPMPAGTVPNVCWNVSHTTDTSSHQIKQVHTFIDGRSTKC